VLKRAETDINKFTDLEVSFTEKKLGRKVVEITYTIRKNTTDLKTFIKVIREAYINQILHYTKDNRPIKCSAKGFLYYGDEDKSFIDSKEAQKLWEYLHENRKELYLFGQSLKEAKNDAILSSLEFFKIYIQDNFPYKKIIELRKKNIDKIISISIFPNGKLFDMSGEDLESEEITKIWDILYSSAKKGKLEILDR